MNRFLTACVIALIAMLVTLAVAFDGARDRNIVMSQNEKAYKSQIDDYNETNKAFMMTIDELMASNDSMLAKLDSLRREIGIRDSRIKNMGSVKEYIHVTDTITVHDTILSEPGFELDTTVGDRWYTNRITLRYPGVISSDVQINTEQSCFMHVTREPVGTPRRTCIGRFFQKKHDVYNVTVIEGNPYAKVRENRFVIINDK